MNRRDILIGAGIVAGLAGLSGTAVAQTAPPDVAPDKRRDVANWPTPKETIDLWPNGAPGQQNKDLKEVVTDDSSDPKAHFRWLSGVSRPRLSVFPAANPNGAAMLITPGGSYARNYFDHEGYLLADYLNAHGISAFVLFYRLPAEGWDNASDAPVSDAQRAMRLIRANAARFGIDPARVGAMGFSAGGHLCASIGTRYDAPVYKPVDQADTLSARPFLIAPIYPVISTDAAVTHMQSRENLLGKNPTADQLRTYSPDRMVTKDTPPAFLVHAEDDNAVPVENTLMFRAACKTAGVTVETHLFAQGGHGFGMKADAGPARIWPELFMGFAQARGLFA